MDVCMCMYGRWDVWVGEWMYIRACMVDGMYGWVSGCMCMYGGWDVCVWYG